VDSYVVFFTRVRSLVEPGSIILDVGCGRGACADDPTAYRRQLRTFKGLGRRVIGIDVDPTAASHPFLDEFRLVPSANAHWPVESASIDVAVSCAVLEHVEDPVNFFSECSRVLKPGGYLCLRTSNTLSYAGLAARLIPNRYHAAVLRRLVAHPRRDADVFPTRHRCNTVFKIRRMLTRFGFDHYVYGYHSQPTSLSFSRILYTLGVVHQHIAPHYLKPTIFAFARRLPSSQGLRGSAADSRAQAAERL
jgi:SAM-dependent methyltransferase